MPTTRSLPLLGLLAVTLLVTGIVLAQSSYDLSWHTMDGGGGTSSGGPYALSATIGQPDAGAMSGGEFALQGGFWAAGSPAQPQFKVYLPTVVRGP